MQCNIVISEQGRGNQYAIFNPIFVTKMSVIDLGMYSGRSGGNQMLSVHLLMSRSSKAFKILI